jgi:hypothetical protein
MKNYDYWKKSQITDISTFCYWLHQKGVGIYVLRQSRDCVVNTCNWIFLIFFKFWNFLKISEFSLIDDAVRVLRINIKLLCNPFAELKFRENDSHCRSILLKTMDCSIVKQLEKEKYSNFNVENFVVMSRIRH